MLRWLILLPKWVRRFSCPLRNAITNSQKESIRWAALLECVIVEMVVPKALKTPRLLVLECNFFQSRCF